MKFFFNLKVFKSALAIFSMFFGAGSIVVPLSVGQMSLGKSYIGITGLLLSATITPFIGLLAMIKYKGDYNLFFGEIEAKIHFTYSENVLTPLLVICLIFLILSSLMHDKTHLEPTVSCG